MGYRTDQEHADLERRLTEVAARLASADRALLAAETLATVCCMFPQFSASAGAFLAALAAHRAGA